jgi:phage terminase large subunit
MIDERKILEKRALYRNNIPLFSTNVLRINPEPAQRVALRNYQETGRIAVKAGHGVGKTVLIVIAMFHQLFCYTNSIVPCTAPTQHQLFDILWTEAARWMANNELLKGFFKWTATRISVRGFESTWFAPAIPSSNADSLSGFHAKHLLYLIDEAPGIKESSWPVIEGALTTPGSKAIMIGNPTKISGYFYDAFGANAADWRGSTISCIDSKYADPEYPRRIARLYGINSNIYRVRVLGQFPKGEDDSILDIDLVREAMVREGAPTGVIEGGCDVARYGNDRTEIYIRKGYEVVDHKEIFMSDLSTLEAVCMNLIRLWKPESFKVDQTGMGSGVVDSLIKQVQHEHLPTMIVGIDNNQTAVDKEKYENAGTEMYFNLQEVLKLGKIPDDDELLGELSLRKYRIHKVTGRLVINSKEDLRMDMKRSGLIVRSPDKADALALCFYSVAGGKARTTAGSSHDSLFGKSKF